MIFMNSPDIQLARSSDDNFGRIIDTSLPTCSNTPFDYVQKPCVDLVYFIDDFDQVNQEKIVEMVELIKLKHEMKNVKGFKSINDFKNEIQYL